MEDLFPGQSPPSKGTPGSVSRRRMSIGGSASGSINAERHRRATLPVQQPDITSTGFVAEPDAEQMPQANLAARFDGTEEPTQSLVQQARAIKTPKVFYRHSLTGRQQ